MAANVLVLFVCTLISGAFMFSFLGNYIIKSYSNELLDDSMRINNATTFFISNKSHITEKLYSMNLEGICKRWDGMAFITDLEGRVVISSNQFGATTSASSIDKKIISEVISEKQSIKFSDFNGTFTEEGLTVGVPFEYNGEIIGATFLVIPTPELYRSRYEIFKAFLFAMVIAIIISAVISYLLSLYMILPIKSLNQVAKRISKGDFKARVKIRGKDEIAQLGETFNLMATSLENLDNVRSSFVSNVSHELRTPMTTISGFVEGILDGTIPEKEQKRYLTIVLDETKRLARLVAEFLLLTKLESGEKTLEKKVFDINELIRVSVLKFEKQLVDKNISVDINFGTEKAMVLADKDSISRVLTNLFDNAVKFNFENGYLKIEVFEKNKKINVSVENSGIGINSEELGLIWERFYKTDKSRSLDKKGVGLGLYLIQNIIATHGEKIWAESENNAFARFIFTLSPSEE